MALSPITVPADAGKIWWQVPEAVWLRFTRMRNQRLFNAVEVHLLPLLVQIEALYTRENGSYKPVLRGRSMAEILRDPSAVEIGLGVFDLAVSEKLVDLTKSGKRKKGFGSCNLTVKQAKNAIIRKAARTALTAANHDVKNLDLFFGEGPLTDPLVLSKLMVLLKFDPLTTRELKVGLGRQFSKLGKKDSTYLKHLAECRPLEVLRPLRKVLDKDFAKFLDWDAEFMAAIVNQMGHSAKILALGRYILLIEDAEVVKALGNWAIEEMPPKPGEKKKKYRTRIAEIIKLLGSDFSNVLASSPKIIASLGERSDEEIDRLRHFLGVAPAEVLDVIDVLSFEHQLGILDGLWEKFGKSFLETEFASPRGRQAAEAMVEEVKRMERVGNSPTDLKSMVVSDFFKAQLSAFDVIE